MSKLPFEILLASTSPRRIELLKQVGLTFQTFAPEIDEKAKKNEKPQILVSRLATEKAEAAIQSMSQHRPSYLVIAADTIVVSPVNKKILGKPQNEKEAKKMLNVLSGRTHTVLTGYCMIWMRGGVRSKKVVRVVKTQVKMRTLNNKSIESYVASGEPMDKAGSYGAQGLGMALIENINGSYTNVVGLPISQLLADLEALSQIPLYC